MLATQSPDWYMRGCLSTLRNYCALEIPDRETGLTLSPEWPVMLGLQGFPAASFSCVVTGLSQTTQCGALSEEAENLVSSPCSLFPGYVILGRCHTPWDYFLTCCRRRWHPRYSLEMSAALMSKNSGVYRSQSPNILATSFYL